MRFIAGFILMSVAALPSVAGADALSDQRAAKFRAWDTNGNGVLEKGEYPGHPGNFRALDVDGNGVLALNEFIHRNHGAPAEDEQPPMVAAPGAGLMVDHFTAMDMNRDGRLSRAEWTGTAANFNITDRNNDRMVTREEYANTPQPNSPEWTFGGLDANNDGWVTRSEWPDDRVVFDRIDRDNDGRISWGEYQQAPPANDAQAGFDGLDRDNDGVISRNEWTGQSVAFHRADRNGDRVITWREYSTLPQANPEEAKFDGLDRDHDGVLEPSEWPSTASVSFDVADRNDDGAVTFMEYLTPTRPMEVVEHRFEDMDHDNDGVLTRAEWHGDPGGFNRRDRNRDGVVTWREFRQPVAPETRGARFQEMDRNNDGRLSRQEWRGDWESFSILDRSRDRYLSRAEYMNTRGLQDRFGYLDHDDDGVLSRQEWLGSADTFSNMDANRDGRVSRDEFML